ncbi:hypothetical protein [Sorangium cellulosum]|uniref:hypothetical protein n=1 Tax=Sorangium cellulosum TaxID=56 RepID=UPI0012FF706A|nr:hypothetical protein [Sorangium cellulosum]
MRAASATALALEPEARCVGATLMEYAELRDGRRRALAAPCPPVSGFEVEALDLRTVKGCFMFHLEPLGGS